VVVVDLKTNEVKRQISLAGLTCGSSRVQYIAVEQTDSGRTFVYVSDATNNAVLVWDVLQARGFRVNLPDEMLSGCGADATPRDVLYMALAYHPDGSRMLAITYLSSCVMFTLRTEFLRRASDSGRVVSRGLKQDRLVLLGADGGPGVFFRYVGKPEIYRWDTRDAFAAENFDKVYEGQPHRLATCVAADYLKKRMLVLESNFQCFANGCVGSGVSHTITPMHKKQFMD
jgi:Major royal jelly protein